MKIEGIYYLIEWRCTHSPAAQHISLRNILAHITTFNMTTQSQVPSNSCHSMEGSPRSNPHISHRLHSRSRPLGVGTPPSPYHPS